MINRVDMYHLASFTGRLGAKAKQRPISDPPTIILLRPENGLDNGGQLSMYGQGCAGKDVPEATTMVPAGPTCLDF
jgi:hypothetical protein